nr:MAG TPA: GlnD PII-uridylyltransferase [Caudoviricetes sp.]DAM55823.1 MAG TPA: GlnD PII-uridylyltransferase [Caudoviricetes sp.]
MGRNPLMDVLSPQPSQPSPSKGGFGGLGDIMGLVTQFRLFAQTMTPEKAEAEIAKLLSSGQMTREQFQELKENAKFVLRFLK